MVEPNFSESQLQQAANTAFIRRVVEANEPWLFAHILSLPDEFLYGWDTAFYLKWLPHLPELNHAGCNFFIQYKLSNQYTSAGASEWNCWKAEFFRFKIPHNGKDGTGNYFDDYHQWSRLKALADKKYPTYYATNAMLKKSELDAAYDAGVLLNDVPLLDVRTIKGMHKHVTFTPTSGNFKLHSELEDLPGTTFSAAVDSIREEPQLVIAESNEQLLSVLRGMEQADESWIRDLVRIEKYSPQLPRGFAHWAKRNALQSFVRKHIGVHMLWMPENG